jgi:hypothetical protein
MTQVDQLKVPPCPHEDTVSKPCSRTRLKKPIYKRNIVISEPFNACVSSCILPVLWVYCFICVSASALAQLTPLLQLLITLLAMMTVYLNIAELI